jgi:hypothetical protein
MLLLLLLPFLLLPLPLLPLLLLQFIFKLLLLSCPYSYFFCISFVILSCSFCSSF